MSNWWLKFSQQQSIWVTILTLSSCWVGNTNLTQAQVVPDETLGNEASVVNQINETLQQIEGGALRGENLFHSFLEFSINEGNAVYFTNPAEVVNIFSRVTGTNISQILGTLGVSGDANLYFVNPNGILFGANAQLDIAGSFFANSGSGFILPNGAEYSATNPQAPPLLTVNTTAPVGIRFEGSEGIITNQAQLTAGNNLTLAGNELNLQGQILAQGDLTLQALNKITIRDSVDNPFFAVSGNNLIIEGNQIDIFALNHPDSGFFSGGDMVLRSTNNIGGDAHYWSGGSFRIEQLDGSLGNWLSPFDPVIRASGDVSFNSYTGASLHILAGGSVTISGNITITGPDTVANSIREEVPLSDSTTVVDIDGSAEPTLDIRAGTTAFGMPGITGSTAGFRSVPPDTDGTGTNADIRIDGRISVFDFTDGGKVFLTNQYKPNLSLNSPNGIIVGSIDARDDFGGGSVIIDSRSSITLNGTVDVSAFPLFGIFFRGDGGDVTLRAQGDILLKPGATIESVGLLGGNITLESGGTIDIDDGFIASITLDTDEGIAGNIELDASSISLKNFARVLAGSLDGGGQGGNLMVEASDKVEVLNEGGNSISNPSNALVRLIANQFVTSTGFATSTAGTSDAGDLTIKTGQLIIKNSAPLDSSMSQPSEAFTGATTVALGGSSGDAGNLTVNASESVEIVGNDPGPFTLTPDLQGARSILGIPTGLTTASNGSGDAGDLTINTEQLTIRDGAAATSGNSETSTGDGGKLTVNATKVTLQGRGGLASGMVGSAGNAGDLIVNADAGSVKLTDGAAMAADTLSSGDAGDLTINTAKLFVGSGSRIGAATAGGLGGTITVNASDRVRVVGTSADGKVPSGLFTLATPSSTGNGGNLTIETRELIVEDGARVDTSTLGEGNAGDINLKVNQLNIAGELGIFAETQSRAEAGSLTIQPYETNPNLNIKFTENNGVISARTTDIGKGGSITITAPENIDIRGLGSITAETYGSGEAGNINIDTHNLTIASQVTITTSTESSGNAGLIIINADESIFLTNKVIITSEVREEATGTSEGIVINTPILSISDRSTISAATKGEGNPGSIFIRNGENNANQVNIVNNSTISTEINGEGDRSTAQPANITINADNLNLDNSEITASTTANRDAGNINIFAEEFIIIDDNSLLNVQTDSIGKAGNIQITTDTLTIGEDSELSAKTTINATGDAGSINIFANILDITGELGIFAETDGIADAGSLNINPNDNPNLAITFFDEGQISASTSNAGDGGDININAPQTINLKGNGTIKVETTGTGNAGDINFNSQQLNISEGVTISALTSGDGEAGSINLEIGEEIVIDSGTTFTVETDGEKDAGDIELSANKITIGEDAELSARSTENAWGKAGNIALNTNQLTIFGDKGIFAETLGDGEGGTITIQPLDKNLPLQISFFNDGIISASTSGSGDGGDIQIIGSKIINLTGNGNLQVETDSSGDAGSIIINADNQINLSNEINISASTFSSGKAGNINLSAPNTINISGDGIIKVETEGSGDAGSIFIESNEINLSDGITLSASTSNIGDSKDITLTGNFINLYNANIQALTTGEGNPGSIVISNGKNNANQVNIVNDSTISTEINGEGDRSTAQPANITIKSDNLSIQSSQITASTTSNRDAGNINLTGNKFNLDNSNIQALTSGEGNPGSILISNGEISANQVNITNNSTISTEIRGKGDRDTAQPANININSDNLFLQSSEITASTNSNRDAGNINLNNNNISLDDGTITAITQGSGDGGDIDIPSADKINLINNSEISASTTAEGIAGSLDLKVNQIVSIDSGSKLKVETSGSGDAGEIKINSPILTLGEDAELSARTSNLGKAGNVTIKTNQLNIAGELGIFAETEGEGIGGNLIINPQLDNPNLEINFTTNNGRISASTFALGEGGDIKITALENINISGDGSIKVETQGEGNAGDIEIITQNLNITGGIEITASTLVDENSTIISLDSGDAGNIILSANNINIDGSQINAFTNSTGNAGSITINYQEENSDNITLTNSTISTTINADGNRENAQPANITIKTDNLSLDKSTITASTNANRKAGDIVLNTNQLSIFGAEGILAETKGEGEGGKITIQPLDNSFSLEISFLNDGKISASTSGSGKGGDIKINASDNLNISGDGGNINITNLPNLTISGGGKIEVETTGDGKAGIINLFTEELTLKNGVEVTASTFASGKSGDINFFANNINLDNAKIQAVTQSSGEGGNINIPDGENLNLVNNSQISASTIGEGFAGSIDFNLNQTVNIDIGSQLKVETESIGDAGDIEINTPTLTIGENGKLSAISKKNATGKAGNIELNTNQLTIFGEEGILAETEGEGEGGKITIQPLDNNLSLEINFFNDGKISASTDSSGKGGNIEITDSDVINISGDGIIEVETSGEGNAGRIKITSENLSLTEGIKITASTTSSGNAGNINLDANFINLNQAQINAFTNATGNAGSITISPRQDNNFAKITLSDSVISTEIKSKGNADNPSNITIQTDNLISNNSTITASTAGKGNAGNINIQNTQQIELNNSQISTETNGIGNAGQITIPDIDRLYLNNNSTISTAIALSGIATQPSNIEITASQVFLNNNSQITAETAGQGKAGSINLYIADNLSLNKNSIISSAAGENASQDGGNINITTPKINLNNQSKITVNSEGLIEANAGEINLNSESITLNNKSQISGSTSAGQGGNLNLNAQNLTLENGSKIITTTSGKSQAGNINLIISEQVNIMGTKTAILADTTEESRGKGGNIDLQTPELLIENGGIIDVDSDGKGEGGNLTISTENLTLNQGAISAETTSGDGGNINLTIQEVLTMRNNSKISTTAGNQQTGGNGGNINIFARYILAIPEENSDITANAFTGKGGQIFITTETIFGIEPRKKLTLRSDITASSELGVDGIIEITRLNVDPLEGLTNLPETRAEVQVAQGCDVGGEGSISFYDLGKGGLTAKPGDYLIIESIITPWIRLTNEVNPQSWNLEKNKSVKISDSETNIIFTFSCGND